MTRQFGEINFSVNDGGVAPYDYLTDTVGTKVDWPELQDMEFTIQFEGDKVMAEGANRYAANVAVGGEVTIKGAGVPFSVLEALGFTLTTSGTTPEQLNDLDLSGGGSGMPYFSIGGVAINEDGDALHVGAVACKVKDVTGFKMEQNKFLNLEIKADIVVPSGRKLLYAVGQETGVALDFTTLFA